MFAARKNIPDMFVEIPISLTKILMKNMNFNNSGEHLISTPLLGSVTDFYTK